MKLKKATLILILPVILIFVIFGGCIYYAIFKNMIDNEIEKVVEREIKNETNPFIIIEKLENWFRENIDYVNINDTIYTKFERDFWCYKTPEMTFKIKKGRCGEWAKLYSKMLNYSGIRSRVVCFVEDHCLVEAYVNNSWIPVEPKGGIKSYEYYRTSRNVSKAFAIGEKIDLTTKYADIGYLVIKTIYNDEPVPKTKVFIYSKYLMLAYPESYKKPYLTTWNYTNEFGVFTEFLGKGIYRVKVIRHRGLFDCLFAERDNYTITAFKDNHLVLKMEKKGPFKCLLYWIRYS